MTNESGDVHVRMKPIYEVIAVDDGVVLRSPDQGVRVRVEGMTSHELATFLKDLDGTRPLAHCLERREQTHALTTLVEGLQARDIVEPGSLDPLPEDARFFSHHHDDPLGCARRVATSRVVICGRDPIADAVAGALQRAGVGSITRVADAVRPASGPDENGATRAPVTVSPSRDPDATIDHADAAPALIAGDLVVVCPDAGGGRLESAVNTLAIEHGFAWVLVRIFGARGFVGPLFIPDDGPCYACLAAREEANWADRELTRAYVERLAHDPSSLAAYGRLAACESLVTDVAALEATKYLSRFTSPSLFGTVLSIDFVACRTELHRVLRLPRCPSCSPVQRRPRVDALLYARGR